MLETSTPTQDTPFVEWIATDSGTTYMVESDRDRHAFYSVFVTHGRVMSCTCKGYTHYQKPCKHMRRLQGYLDRRVPVSEADWRKAARCPACGDHKQHGDLLCNACYRADMDGVA